MFLTSRLYVSKGTHGGHILHDDMVIPWNREREAPTHCVLLVVTVSSKQSGVFYVRDIFSDVTDSCSVGKIRFPLSF